MGVVLSRLTLREDDDSEDDSDDKEGKEGDETNDREDGEEDGSHGNDDDEDQGNPDDGGKEEGGGGPGPSFPNRQDTPPDGQNTPSPTQTQTPPSTQSPGLPGNTIPSHSFPQSQSQSFQSQWTTTTHTPSTPITPSPTGSNTRQKTAIALGAALGAILFFLLIATFLILRRRKRNRVRESPSRFGRWHSAQKHSGNVHTSMTHDPESRAPSLHDLRSTSDGSIDVSTEISTQTASYILGSARSSMHGDENMEREMKVEERLFQLHMQMLVLNDELRTHQQGVGIIACEKAYETERRILEVGESIERLRRGEDETIGRTS